MKKQKIKIKLKQEERIAVIDRINEAYGRRVFPLNYRDEDQMMKQTRFFLYFDNTHNDQPEVSLSEGYVHGYETIYDAEEMFTTKRTIEDLANMIEELIELIKQQNDKITAIIDRHRQQGE